MPAYVIADIEVIDSAGFEEYRRLVPATIAAHGGRYLARGGATEVLVVPEAVRRRRVPRHGPVQGLVVVARIPAAARAARADRAIPDGRHGRRVTWDSDHGSPPSGEGDEGMSAKPPANLKDGAYCTVIGGTHKGKSGTVGDIKTGKTGHVSITVKQSDGERFKTLAKNVVIQGKRA
jgi:hypothetical protein